MKLLPVHSRVVDYHSTPLTEPLTHPLKETFKTCGNLQGRVGEVGWNQNHVPCSLSNLNGMTVMFH
jgi:hypothetical protein